MPQRPSLAACLWAALTGATHAAGPIDRDGFRRVVGPFLKQHCLKCHAGDRAKAGLDLSAIKPGDDHDTWRAVADRVNLGDMPPEGEPRPGAKLSRRVVAWAVAELRRVGQAPAPVRMLPSHGNRVPHGRLFGVEPDPRAVPPPRLWRVSPYIYDSLMRDIAKRAKLAAPFTHPPGAGFKDYAGRFRIDEPTAAQLIRNALAVAGHQTRYKIEKGRMKGVWGAKKDFLRLLDPDQGLTDEAIDRATRTQFREVLRREPDADELERYRGLMRRNVRDAGRELGVRTTLAAVILRPEVLFRSEVGTGGRLGPREAAFALAYALTDRRPDGELLRAAERGRLATREQVAEQFERIWAARKIHKPRVLRFFREFFGYADATEVFKEKKDFKDHNPQILVADTDQLILHILEEDRDVLKRLLTTNESFVSYRVDRKRGPMPAHRRHKVHMSYGLPEDWEWRKDQPVRLPGRRAGILTQPSWLVAHSLNLENHPIIRGKWVRERLLGGTVPDLPITVDARLPEDADRTLRQRLAVTRQDYCWQCHRKMNDLGLPFEGFDHFGRPRAAELNKPVDTSGLVAFSGDRRLDGPVTGVADLARRLADSGRVRQVFVRHAFRFFLGRNETPADAKTLQDADRAYVSAAGSFKALVKSIVTSDSFLKRGE